MQWIGIGIIISGLILVGLASFISPEDHSSSSSGPTAGQQVAGIVLLLSGMVFTGLQV